MPQKDLVERTMQYAIRIIECFRSLPRETEAQIIGKQLLRSGTSVGANFREAQRAQSDADLISKLAISLKELEESAYWLELMEKTAIFPKNRLAPLQDETQQLIAIFTSITKKKKQSMRNRW